MADGLFDQETSPTCLLIGQSASFEMFEDSGKE